jgi:hypothetical protein
MSRFLLATALLTGTMLSGAAMAANIDYKATLTTGAEVPPKTTPGHGEALISLDTTTKMLRWVVTYSDLTGPATMGHFHGPAAPGANAAVVVPFANAASPIIGSATLTDAQMKDLMSGKYYVNIHTAANPGGEIRGQVTK